MYDHILMEAATLPSGVQLPDVAEDASEGDAAVLFARLDGLVDGHASAEDYAESGVSCLSVAPSASQPASPSISDRGCCGCTR